MAYNVGQAEVTVLPNAERFNADLAAKLLPAAETVGREAGERLAKEIEAHLATIGDANIGVDTGRASAEVDKFVAETKVKTAAAGDVAGKNLGNNLSKSAAASARHGSPLIMAAVAGGLIAGGPVLLAAAGGVFGGLAALILHNQQQVASAASHMAEAVTTEYTDVAQVATPFLVKALGDIQTAAHQMAPAVGAIFSDIQPAIDGVVGGITDLARNALPGLGAAIHSSAPVFAGLRSLLADIGTGLGNFFSLLSTHSAAMGTVLSSLGDALNALLTGLGSLAVAGSELGSAILPPLASVLGVLADVLHFLEPVLPSVALAFAAWKVAGILAPLIGRLAVSLEETGASAMVAVAGLRATEGAGLATGTAFGTAAAGARGLQAAMGPIAWVGLALGALIPLLSGQSDAEKQVTDATQAMTEALKQSKGAIDDTVRAQAAANAQSTGLLTWAKTIGVAGSTVVDALLGVPGAMDKVTRASQAYDAAQNSSGTAGYKNADGSYASALAAGKNQVAVDKATRANHDHKKALDDQAVSVQRDITNQEVLQAAISGSGDATALNTQRLQDLANAAGAADAQINQLKGALDALTGKAVTLDAAQIAVTQAVANATGALKNMKGAMVDANGHLDLTTAKGAAAGQSLIRMGDASHQLIATMEQQGKTSAEVGRAQDGLRAQFISTARQMGFNQREAETLADRYLGLNKPVKTEIRADTTQADAAIRSITTKLLGIQDRTVYVRTVTLGSGAQQIHRGVQATAGAIGGVVHAYANGGIEPMSGGIAQIMPPNRLRVIGDRITDDEAFIPINRDLRSQQIWMEAGHRMGMLGTSLQPAAAAGGRQATFHVENMVVPDKQHPQETAEALAFMARTRG